MGKERSDRKGGAASFVGAASKAKTADRFHCAAPEGVVPLILKGSSGGCRS